MSNTAWKRKLSAMDMVNCVFKLNLAAVAIAGLGTLLATNVLTLDDIYVQGVIVLQNGDGVVSVLFFIEGSEQ